MFDAYVIADDVTALVAALDLAEVGLQVRVQVADDLGLHSWQFDSEGALAGLMRRLADPVSAGGPRHDELLPEYEPPRPVFLRSRTGAWLPAPQPDVFGIPAVPLSAQSIALLGSGAAFRAYLDRIKPILTIGKTQGFGPLVTSRIGTSARAVLVDPIVRERFGRGSDGVDAAIAAPGLNETMSRTGSLTGAVLAYSERYVARETRVRPMAGWDVLRARLIERLELYSVEFVSSPVSAVVSPAVPAMVSTQISRVQEDGADAYEISHHDGSASRARSIVIGAGVTGVTRVAGETRSDASNLVGGLQPAAVTEEVATQLSIDPLRAGDVRVEASIRTEWPAWLSSVAGVAEGGAASFVSQTALHAAGEGEHLWSARLDVVEDTSILHVQGPAVSRESAAFSRNAAEQLLAHMLVTAVRSAEWRGEIVAAPYTSHNQRDADTERRTTFNAEHPHLVVLGAALHGGDVSVAVDSEHDQIVELRRRLLGLTE